MREARLADYLDHVRQAAADACRFIEGLSKEDFLADKRTQQAVIMSLIIIGEAATKVMDRHAELDGALKCVVYCAQAPKSIGLQPASRSTSNDARKGA